MSIPRLLTIACFLTVGARADLARAQVGPPDQSSLSITSECVNPILRLTVEAVVSPTMNPAVVAFDLRRRPFGGCEKAVSVSELSRGLTGVHSYWVEDSPPLEGFLYEYEVVPVDANGDRVDDVDVDPAGFDAARFVYETCSTEHPLLGHGVLELTPFGAGLLVPCTDACGEEFFFATNLSQECGNLIDSGVEVEVFGYFADFIDQGTLFWSTSCEPKACTPVTTETATWGAVKARF